jgi:sortase (surface protein transpeptidase)
VTAATPPPITTALAPTRLVIPAIDVDMPVTNVGVEPSGLMELPADPKIAGWYRYGPDAASTAGNTVVSAHVDAVGYGLGPLSRLRDLGPGEQVSVTAADGSTRMYAIESVTYYNKTQLPIDQIFARDGAPALVIITCGGPFDSATGHYTDNVVAIARPQS